MSSDEDGPPQHGTAEHYRHGCRCKRCRALGDVIETIAAHIIDMIITADLAHKVDAPERPLFEEARKILISHLGRLGSHPGFQSHGTFKKYTNGCRCEACVSVARQHRNRIQKRANSETLATATNHYKQWTGPELEIASRTDLTARQAAQMLGRTLKSVKHIRAKLLVDPRYRDTAGVLPGTPRVIGK
jgi:hypothetical protein